MEIKVYNISDEINEEELNEIAIKNIGKIFDKVFSRTNISHLKVNCRVAKDSIIKEYNQSIDSFNLKKFAEKLNSAELKQDGTRNNQIKVGSLFIKKEQDRLILLKLENIEVIDRDRDYEMRQTFSTETEYYKGCIFNNDINDIIIIDKNKSISKYWREVFLNLSLIKDEYNNTVELIELLKNDKLFSGKIKNQDNYLDIKKITESYLFSSDSFDKNELANKLRADDKIDELSLNEVFSYHTEEIDADFKVSKKALIEGYKKTIHISSETKIYTDNFQKLIRKQGIEYKDGNIILKVDDDFMEKLPEELKNEN
ncbi:MULTISPECIES: hypothetical protein [unclassified Sporosarcina]|uniref:hypothetical protein n=1 Tax=unclassified Sporosarcina TaxID=2647733 RepID=UPI0020413818|nr:MULTISPECIES: hypothetical protein [unclassified Sporosarcina]GKV65544.1 hypothetical protein NCCP2331_16970 [Sporosarcina sp. NCCP-2331]GLB55669.1 hypothetical protein NCCP2378_14560 [Sporosarcina sp. NCCP-2378]